MRRFAHGRYLTDVAAELPDEVEAALPGGRHAFALALMVGRRTLEHAALSPNTRIGLALATTKAEIESLERMVRAPGEESDGRDNPGVFARDLAAELRLTGPVAAVSAACASGVAAIVHAARLLKRGDADMMLVIGVDVLADFVLAGFSSLAALSARPCRPYDGSRDGLSLGEGAGALLLTRECPAALGVVAGWGITNDASHVTAPSRNGRGLALAMERALETSGLDAGDVHYINGHGTGTRYNDEMEAKAIGAVFSGAMPPVSSMKGYFGHTSGAAGVIEAALCLAAMRERTVPASMGLERAGEECAGLNLAKGHVRLDRMENVVTVKSGFGGVNGALVLSRGSGR